MISDGLPCTEAGHVSPIDIEPPFPNSGKLMLSVELNFLPKWQAASKVVMSKIDNSTLSYTGKFGTFTIDGITYESSHMYILRSSGHRFKGKNLAMEVNIDGKSSSGKEATLVTLVELDTETKMDSFFLILGFGSGNVNNLVVGDSKVMTDDIDLTGIMPAPLVGDSYFHYDGNSMFETCAKSKVLVNKVTMLITQKQIDELGIRTPLLNIYPIKVQVFDSNKPPEEPPKTQLSINNSTTPSPKNTSTSESNPTKVTDSAQAATLIQEPPTQAPPNTSMPTNTTKSSPPPIDPNQLDQPNPSDPVVFDDTLYTNNYDPYPPPRNTSAPKNSENYPYAEFPYPDTWPWTGEPNYPNDPWYPQYVFPEQNVFPESSQDPNFDRNWTNNELPQDWPTSEWPKDYLPKTRDPYSIEPVKKYMPYIDKDQPLENYEVHYGEPVAPDQNPEWPHGYPIWPDLEYPSFPQNYDFYPRVDDPYSLKALSWPKDDLKTKNASLSNQTNNTNSNTTLSPIYHMAMKSADRIDPEILLSGPKKTNFPIHYELPEPVYTYPNTSSHYPRFPDEHWPDNPFNPRMYRGYPKSPSRDYPPTHPHEKLDPIDPKIRWPQNPYFTWPKSKDFKWPKDHRFKWPQAPSDPKWMWPLDPTKDPKWRKPLDPTSLPQPIYQRTPEDPVKVSKPIPMTPYEDPFRSYIPELNITANNTQPIKSNEPEKLLGPLDEKVKAQPLNTTNPDTPKTVVHHRFDPFGNPLPFGATAQREVTPKVETKTEAYIEKPIPSLTQTIKQPTDNQFMNMMFPNRSMESPDGKFTQFSFPELGKVPEPRAGYEQPNPKHLITKPHNKPPFPVDDEDVPRVYKGIPNQPFGLMPPKAIPVWEKINAAKYSRVFRSPPPAPAGSKYIPYFHYPLPHKTVNGRPAVVPQYILVNENTPEPTMRPESIPILIGKNQSNLTQYDMPVLSKPVDPLLREKLRQYTAKQKVLEARKRKNQELQKSKVLRERAMLPLDERPEHYNYDHQNQEITGYEMICEDWRVGVLVNRHFKQTHEWSYTDGKLDNEGKYRYCVKWRKAPRLANIIQSLPKAVETKINDKVEQKVTGTNASKDTIKALCTNELHVVLNDRAGGRYVPKRTKDEYIENCISYIYSKTQAEKLKDKINELEKKRKSITSKAIVQLAAVNKKAEKLDV